MFSEKPEMAKEWAAATPSMKDLPVKLPSRPMEKSRDAHTLRKRHR